MKNNRIKKAMACLLCIVVLMSSSCAMAGRVDAQAPFLVEDHAVPTTSEFDITAEETEAEIMLLQEEAESEPEASSDVEPAEEESAPEEDAAPAAGHYGWMNYFLSCKKYILSLCILI